MNTAAARRSAREDALLGIPVPLGDALGTFGPKILPLTPWHHLLLLGYANGCFCGGLRTLRAALQYLWLCSPALSTPGAPARAQSKLRFGLFAWRWQFAVSRFEVRPGGRRIRVPTMRALDAIAAHASAIWLDRPALAVRKKTDPDEIVDLDGPHELAVLELVCRRHLGYTRAEYWHTPYIHTNQLLSAHFGPSQPDAPKFNPTRDAAAKAAMHRWRQAHAAAHQRN